MGFNSGFKGLIGMVLCMICGCMGERVVFCSVTLSNAKIISSLVDEWNVFIDRWWNDPDMDSPITSGEKCSSAPLSLAMRKYYIEQICKNKTGSVRIT